MAVFEWIMTHLDMVVILLTVLLNLTLLLSNVVKTLRGERTTALEKWLKLLEAARKYEQEAESFANYSAAEKLNYVLSRLRTLSAELCVPFDEERLVAAVEEDIAFSKTVNAAPAKGEDDAAA